nr:DUF4123 domain-containing protein [Paraburkholderia bannensis]
MNVTQPGIDWIDPYRDDTAARLRELFERSAHEGASGWHLLLDMGFAPTLRDTLVAKADIGAWVVLYDGVYEGDGLLAVSPCLLRLPETIDARMALCEAVLCETNGLPMVSLLQGAHSTAALAAHLRGQMEAQAGDDEAFLVRFADTRCLPAWLDVLTEQQRARFIAGIDAWSAFDRTGTLVEMAIGAQQDPVLSADDRARPYLLDAAQMNALREAARIDTLIYHVRQRPESFGVLVATPSQVYECVRGAWAAHDGAAAAASRVALDALEAAGLLSAPANG